MRTQSCTRSRRIRLNGVALVHQSVVVKLLQKPPQCFDVFVVVGYVRMVKIYEIAHFFGQRAPLFSELHDVLTTFAVIVFYRNIMFRFLVVDVFLIDTQFFFNTQLHWQSVCVPSCLAQHLEPLHGFVPVERVFDGASQYVMNAGMTVCRWRTFKEDELFTTFTLIDRLVEYIQFLPLC